MAEKLSITVAANILVDYKPTDVEIAWAAGIYEGEGHASGIEGRTIAQVSQKDPEILYRLRGMFGGRIEMTRANTDKFLHKWLLYGDYARSFYALIWPYMSARRKQQIEKANGLRFTGFKQPIREPMSQERKALRSQMTPREKVLESYLHHKHSNIERVRATQRAYQARKREQKRLEMTLQQGDN
jgi:hypothetical protein